MLVATCLLFILGLGLAQEQEPPVSDPGTSTNYDHKGSGFLHAEINNTDDFDFDKNSLIWSLQRCITFPLVRDFMKFIAKLNGTTLKSLWNVLNNMQGSRTFLDALFYEYLPDFTGEEFEFSPQLSEKMRRVEDRLSYEMVHKSGSLGVPDEDPNSLNTDQGFVSDIKDWERIDSNRESHLAFGDKECISNIIEEPTDVNNQYPIQIGSIIGIPGEDFPDYYDIPITSFRCADKKRIPGFYADLETGCQVFHVCWPHRRESFLCPVGTIFNQAILACDYWYSTDCSLAPLYYDNDPFEYGGEVPTASTESVIDDLLEKTADRIPAKHRIVATKQSVEHIPKDDESEDLSNLLKFLPVKSKITSYLKPVETMTRVSTTPSSEFEESIPEKVKTHSKGVLDGMLLSDLFGIADNKANEAMKLVSKLKSKDTEHQIQEAVKTKSSVHEPHPKQTSKLIPLILKKPTVTVVQKEKPLTKINPRFVVKPISIKTKQEKLKAIPSIKSSKLSKPNKPLKGYSSNKLSKQVPEGLSKSFKLVKSALHDILPLTRKILIESMRSIQK